MRQWVAFWTLMLALLGSAAPAFAETRLALVVAQSSYGGAATNLPRLDNTPAEADLVANALANPLLNFTVTRHKNLTKVQLADALDAFRRKVEAAGPDTIAFIYFTGHGLQAPGETSRAADNFLIGVDANIRSVGDLVIGGVSVREQTRAFEYTQAKAVVFVVDACRNNPASLGLKSGGKGLASMKASQGMLIAYATSADEVAQEGVYAPVLARELVKPGRTLGETFLAIQTEVARQTRTSNRPQLPYNDIAIYDDIYLAGKAAALPPVPAPLDRDTLDSLAWLKAQDADTASAYLDYLANFSSGRYAAKARARIADLTPKLTPVPVVAPKPAPFDLETDTFTKVERANTLAAYQEYLRQYPNGKFKEQANAAIRRLTPVVAPLPTTAFKTLDARKTKSSIRAPLLPKSVIPRDLPDFALFRECESCPDMVVLPGGSFMMGSPQNEVGRQEVEDDTSGAGGSQINVSINRFAMSRFETTWDEWTACVAAGMCSAVKDDGFGKGNRPVTNVAWQDIDAFARHLNSQVGVTGYRRPSESEWEYAARGGETRAYWWGSDYRTDKAHSGYKTLPVGSYESNPFGLFDTTGNVSELVQDCYADSLVKTPRNGSYYSPPTCTMRVNRGGSWNNIAPKLRTAIRLKSTPSVGNNFLGFRLARDL